MTVAIVGGGLCGLALAIALTKKSIPWHLYESRSSFTEIGAGINIGPNTLKAFNAIDSSLAEAIFSMCSRNPAPKTEVWMQLRHGVASAMHADHELITELMAPPTGNMAAHRNDLLQLLASRLSNGKSSFNKKLVDLTESDSDVTLHFDDGSFSKASLVIACDGIHSAVRRTILGESPASTPHFVRDGAYRAMIPVKETQALLGEETGQMSQVLLGPDGYIIMYPIAGGENMNVGFWIRRAEWTDKGWVKEHQKGEMLRQFSGWGEIVHKIMDKIPDPSFWATHCHSIQPENCFVGRVCLIGDAAHSMPPHQGAGAGQAMEDAFVLAEVLSELKTESGSDVKAAFEAFQAVRRPRSQKVLETSVEAMQFWSSFAELEKSNEEIENFSQAARDRLALIWDHDLLANGKAVQAEYRKRAAQAM